MSEAKLTLTLEDKLTASANKAVQSLDRLNVNVEQVNKSLVLLDKEQAENISHLEKAGQSLQEYGNEMAKADAITRKFAGQTIKTAGKGVEEFGKQTSFAETAVEALGLAGIALAAGGFLDKWFDAAGISAHRLAASVINLTNAQRTQEAIQKAQAAATYLGVSANSAYQKTIAEVVIRTRDFAADVGIKAVHALANLRTGLSAAATNLSQLTRGVSNSATLMGSFIGTVAQAGNTFIHAQTGLAGFVTNLTKGGAVLGILGVQMLRADSATAKFAGASLLALSAALGGIAFLVTQVVGAIGGLIYSMGTAMVNATQKQIQSFAEADIKLIGFNQTIRALSKTQEEAAEKTKTWNTFIDQLQDKTGESRAGIQAVTAEIASATEAFHFSEDVQKRLIEASVDLAAKFKIDVVDAATRVLGALNGNSQALIAYGFHINESGIAHSKAGKEYAKTFQKLDDGSKAAVRTNVFFEQMAMHTGFAAAATNSLGRAMKVQENISKDFNAELGKGSSIIEASVLPVFATLQKTLLDLAKPFLPILGFFQAFTGRVLQTVGILVSHIFMISLTIAAYKTLQKTLASDMFAKFIGTEIPFVNNSLKGLIANIAGTNVQIKSLGDIVRVSMQIVKTQTLAMIPSFAAVRAGIAQTGAALASFAVANAPIIAIAAAIGLVVMALIEIEKETQIFSTVWNDLTSAFVEWYNEMSFITPLLERVGHFFKNVLAASVNLVAAQISALATHVLFLASTLATVTNKMGNLVGKQVIAKETVEQLNKAYEKAKNTTGKFAGKSLTHLSDAFMGTAHAAEEAAKRQISSSDAATAKVDGNIKKTGNALEELKKKLEVFSGLGGSAEAQAKTELALAAEKERQAKLEKLRLEEPKRAAQIEAAIAASRMNVMRASMQEEIALAEQRATLLSGQAGQGGVEGAGAQANVEVLKEKEKQLQLQAIRGQELNAEAAYQAALQQVRLRGINETTAMEQALLQQRAELLGLSQAAVEAKLLNQQIEYEKRQEMLAMHLENQFITEIEFQTALQEAELNHTARMDEIRQENADAEIARAERNRDFVRGYQGQLAKEERAHLAGIAHMRAFFNTQQGAALQTTLSETSSLMQSNNKKQFEIGKAAAIAQASINTFMAATGALAALSVIPIVGPALGMAAAALITAAGVMRINQIKQTKFQGGQADEGLESVPKSMDGKSFILAGGERVVAANQNKALGQAIERINSGGAQTNNISVNVNGNADDSTIEKIKMAVMEGIRDASERGQPIINSRGIVNG